MRKMIISSVLASLALGSGAARAALLTEGFESETFPPSGWTWEGINVQPFTWHRTDNATEGTSFPTTDGTHFACIQMPYNHLGVDDWLLTPTIADAPAGLSIDGKTLGSAQQYGWGAYDLELWIINGTGVNDGNDQLVGSLASLWETGPFHWVDFSKNLAGFYTPGDDVRIGFRQLQLSQTNVSALDAITITPEPASLALLALGGLAILRRR